MFDQFFSTAPPLNLSTLPVLLILISLEAVLSADNAIALAALVQGIEDEKLQRQALNLGLVAAFVLRIILIFTATWVIKYWQFELAGAAYLLWLSFQYFTSEDDDEHHHHGPAFTNLWQAIPLLAFTDLAFSFDSVTTAIAVSEDRWLVVTGGVIGIITLRFMAGLFIHWLKEFTNLQDAGYFTVTLVGLRLLLKVFDSQLVPPEWLMISAIAVCFIWGFSKRNPDFKDVATSAGSESLAKTELSSGALPIIIEEQPLPIPEVVGSESD
jgi:YkoY family integral membrane protein